MEKFYNLGAGSFSNVSVFDLNVKPLFMLKTRKI